MLNRKIVVDAGHRAIMFNRISGVGDDVYKEGLHFRVPWFQYPIIYDIRARPNQIRSPTGSKDLQVVFRLLIAFVMFISDLGNIFLDRSN